MSLLSNKKLNRNITIGIVFLGVFVLDYFMVKLNKQYDDVRVLAAYTTPTGVAEPTKAPTPTQPVVANCNGTCMEAQACAQSGGNPKSTTDCGGGGSTIQCCVASGSCTDRYGMVVPNGGTASWDSCSISNPSNCSAQTNGGVSGTCKFDNASHCLCSNGSWQQIDGSGCSGSFSCPAGSSAFETAPPADAYTFVGSGYCSPCTNSKIECYEPNLTCTNNGGTCYSKSQSAGTASSCGDLSAMYPAYVYSSVSGTCASTGICCAQTTKETCADNGGSCGSSTCTARTAASSTLDYSSASGYCAATTPYCCTAIRRTDCKCTVTETNLYTCGEEFTAYGDGKCIPVSCVGTKAVAGGWTAYSYSSWSSCSSCSQTRTGTRSCTNPAPACGGATCSGSATTTESNSAPCVVDATYGSWGSCSASCGWGTQYRSELSSAACGGSSSSTSQSCYMGCCPSNGTSAVCGSSAGSVFTSTPSTNLCSVGSASIVSTSGGTYSWTCYGTAGSCGGYAGSDASCSATRNQAPTLSGFEIRNSSDAVISAESGNLNQICQPEFNRQAARFVVSATDPDGAADIASVQLRMGSQIYSPTSLSGGVAVFDIPYSASNNSASAVAIEVNVADSYQSTGWVSTGRSFKFWNCEVPVSGSLFDGSEATFEVINCGNGSQDFNNKVTSDTVYSLTYTGIALDGDKVMTVNSPDYNGGSNRLMWGAQYRATFTNLEGNTPVMKYPRNNTCNSTSASFTVDNSAQMGVDPYAASQSLVIDYSSILDQFPWYQVAGGGVFARNTISNNIPNTCTGDCKPNISVRSGDKPSGLVAARTITKGSGTFGETTNWGVSKDIIGKSYGYKYFLSEYYTKLGQGYLYNENKTMSQIIADGHGAGVVFVNGKVDFDVNNTVAEGTFFMLVTSGDIEIRSTVNNVQGILISDGNIIAAGSSDDQLKIDGSVYSAVKDVKLARGFATKSLNNKNPGTVVNYRPDFIFSMPGKLTKILSGWKEGI